MTGDSASPRVPVTVRPRRWADIQSAEEARLGGRAELARQLGRNESSLRNWIDRDDKVASSPDFDDAAILLAKAPTTMFFDALRTMAARRAIVCLVNNLDVPARATVRETRASGVALMKRVLAAFERLDQATEDGVIDPGEVAELAQLWAIACAVGEQMVRQAQHCAAQAGRGR